MAFKRTEHKNALYKLVRGKRMILQKEAETIMNRQKSLSSTSQALEKEGKIKRQKVKVRMKHGNLNDAWLLYMPTVKQIEILEYEKELINRPFESPLKEHHCYKKTENSSITAAESTNGKVIEMSGYVKIVQKDLKIKEFNGQRIVTAYDIATLHGKEAREITQAMQRNKNRFIENVDFFTVTRGDSRITKFDSEKLFTNNRQKEVYLYTESGYLMIIKTFNDDLSWTVQRELVNTYFKVKELKQDQSLQSIPQVNGLQTYDILEMMVKEMKNQNNRIDSLELKITRIAEALS